MHRFVCLKRIIVSFGMGLFALFLDDGFAKGQATGRPPEAAISSITRNEESLNRFLDGEKPDPNRMKALKEGAELSPPQGLSGSKLARFYLVRSTQKKQLGLLADAILDAEAAISAAKGTDFNILEAMTALAQLIYEKGGEHKKALAIYKDIEREADRPGAKGWLFSARRGITRIYLALGDIKQAERVYSLSQRLLAEARNWPAFGEFGPRWQSQVDGMAAEIALANQDYETTINAAQRAEAVIRRFANNRSDRLSVDERANLLQIADAMLILQAKAKIGLGRLAEADIDVRTSLTSRVRNGGKFQLVVADQLSVYRNLRLLQGRYDDALQISQRIFEILDSLQISQNTFRYVANLNAKAQILSRLGRREETDAAYQAVDKVTEDWNDLAKQRARSPNYRILYYSNIGRAKDLVTPARDSLARVKQLRGEDHIMTANVRSIYANVLIRSGEVTQGLQEFEKAIPVLLDSVASERDDIDAGGTDGLDYFARNSVLSYLYGLSISKDPSQDKLGSAFRFAEGVRADGVQRALVAASSRAALSNPQLAPIVRQEQDIEKIISKTLAQLEAQLSLSSEDRDQKLMTSLKGEIAKQQKERIRLQTEIVRRFPQYADLISPAVPDVAAIKKFLARGEVFVSIFSGQLGAFVFAFGKETDIKFHRIDARAVEMGALVQNLRKSLDASGGSLIDIPEFDLKSSAKLYELIFKPIESVLESGDRIVAVANGAVAGIPLGLLAKKAPELDANQEPMFTSYRSVPWLIRSHAITMVPSAASFHTLRQTPRARVDRQPFIGFGDPIFNKNEPTDSAEKDGNSDLKPSTTRESITRGLKRSALTFRNSGIGNGNTAVGLSDLQRLPDTADELVSIARSLGADPSKSVILRENATEARVKQMKLTDFKVVAFATHGLAPGEIPSLKIPALAMTAPDVAKIDGDGFLTMDEILQLRLNADWVILSACNTAAGASEGVGAEAISGLGRAFFFAGTRALLVTAWSVHSESARDLVSGIFRRQNQAATTDRSVALQQSMIELMDQGGIKDPAGNLIASYAHPVFWAPYLLIGDGGGQQ